MGEVNRARDTWLKRDVALKILSESFAADPDRVARFQREAEVLASLNHPNITAIYGTEDADGVHALVMELVEGLTLADRIAQGASPPDDALPIAKQIAGTIAVGIVAICAVVSCVQPRVPTPAPGHPLPTTGCLWLSRTRSHRRLRNRRTAIRRWTPMSSAEGGAS